MACSINTLSEMRKTLREGLKASLIDPEIVMANGTSGRLIHAFIKDLETGIRNPAVVENKIKDFLASQENPFHRKIVNEMGDIVPVTVEGKTKEYFLLGTSTRRNVEATGGIEVVLRLAPVTDINKTSSMIVNMASDTGREGLNTINGSIEGISDAIKKGVETVRNLRVMATVERTDPNAGGDKNVRKILDKMQDSDEVLGSRQERTTESLVGYEKVKDYKHGDIGSMKKILMKLHTLGGSRADKSTLKYYSKLLDSMHQRFFNKVDLYYKKNQADSFGYVNLNLGQMKIDVAGRNAKGVYQSEAEVYMHEVIHTMTAWALRQTMVSTTKLRTDLNNIMAEALEKTKWTDLLGKDVDKATEREKANAKSLHNYMFASENSADEFLAIALTNPQAIRHFKSINTKKPVREAKTMLDKMFNAVAGLYNFVLSKLNLKDDSIDVFTQVHELTFKLAEINQNNMDKLDNLNPLGKMTELLETGERFLADHIDKFFDKVTDKNPTINTPGPDESAFKKAKFFLDFSVKMFTSRAYRGYLGMWANMVGIKAGGTIREIAAGMFEKDGVMREVERLDLLATNAQAARNNVITANSRSLLESFKHPLSEEEDSALTTVLLETNVTHLRYNRGSAKRYEDRELIKLLTDKEYRKEREGRVKAAIKKTLAKEEGRANWSIAQAIGLGSFMATGNGHSRTNTNARQIVLGFGSNERFSFNKQLENQLNELASISALNYVSNSDKKLVAELIRTEPKGINTVSEMYESYKANSANTIFKNNEVAMIAGHVKDQLDPTIDIKTAPVADKAEMEAQGYVLRYNIKPHSKVREENPMAVYTTEAWGRAERRAGIVELGGLHTRGTKLSTIKFQADPVLGKLHFERDLALVLADGVKTDIAMREGTFDGSKVEKGILPVYNRAGQIVDFRYVMSKENKKELLKQDLRVSEVLPRSMASVEHQIRTNDLNKAALEAMRSDMRMNWKTGTVGEDSYSEYTLIGPEVLDDKGKELFYLLPAEIREFITNRKDRTLAIRSDVAGIYFGGKHMQISNMYGVNQLPLMFKHSINVMQGMWEELIKISKGAILLKMPVVLVVNITSNILFQIANGHIDIPQLVRDYKDSFREVNEYLKVSRQINKLSYEIDRDVRSLGRVKNTAELQQIISQKKTKLGLLQRQQVNNPSKELFDAGLYQSYLEDTQDTVLEENNRIVKGINQRLAKLPKPLRYVTEVSYMTQNTAWYKVSQEILQRSDMVTRLVDKKRYQREDQLMVEGKKMLPRWWVKQKGEEYKKTQKLTGKEREEFFKQSQQVRFNSLVDNYINYTLPNGNFEEFLNRMGVLMFTKYLKRIQRVLVTSARNNPIKTAAMVLAVGNLMDTSLVQDSAFVARVLGSNGELSLSNLVPMYSPLFHVGNVFTPAIIKDEMLGSAF